MDGGWIFAVRQSGFTTYLP